MTEIKLNDDVEYKLTKVHEDGEYEVKVTGTLWNKDGIIRLEERCTVGRGMSTYWSTSGVQEIEKIHNGVKLTTYNSVYLLEEYVYDPKAKRDSGK